MNKILLSCVAVVSLFSVSAFAMDDPSSPSNHALVKQNEKTITFDFGNLPPDPQAYTLLHIVDQKDLFHVTSTCTSLRKIAEKAFEKIWSQNRLFSVMPKDLPTKWQSMKIFWTMEWGLCSENENYLMSGKLIKTILKVADDYDASYPNALSPHYFSIDHPNPKNNEEMEYRISNRSNNLGQNTYQKIRDYTLFEAIPSEAAGESEICSWGIQGQYPSREQFFLEICNLTLADQEGSEDSDD